MFSSRRVEEARYLQQHLGATVVSAGADTVAQLLSGRLGDGTQDLVHFACHGYVGTTDPSLTGLHVAVGPNGVVLTPHMLRAAPLLRARGPVLFANACDVGTPEQALDAFGGVVGGALRGGCRAVIAPMWKVDDEAASETAQELWARVLGRGEPLGDVLRARRARPADAWRRRDFLSYAYFGDPRLVLARVEGDLPVGVGSGGGTGPSGP